MKIDSLSIYVILGIFTVPFTQGTFLKNKEIAQLESDTEQMSERIQRCEISIDTLVRAPVKSCDCANIKAQIDELTERFNTMEFKWATMIAPKSPGSLSRRPALKRGVSGSSYRDRNLSPSSQPSDYFSPSSPYS